MQYELLFPKRFHLEQQKFLPKLQLIKKGITNFVFVVVSSIIIIIINF